MSASVTLEAGGGPLVSQPDPGNLAELVLHDGGRDIRALHRGPWAGSVSLSRLPVRTPC